MKSLKPLGYYKELKRFRIGGCEKCGGALELTNDYDGTPDYYKCINCGRPHYNENQTELKWFLGGRPSFR